MTIGGQGAVLEMLAFNQSKESDLVVAELPDGWFNRFKISNPPAIPLVHESSWVGTGVYLLMGFPASKNILQPARDKTDKDFYSISASLHSADVPSKVKDAINFHYQPKNTVNSDLVNPGARPPLQGMSGGPALQIVFDPISQELSVAVVGVLCDWKKNKQAVVAAPASAIVRLIEELPKIAHHIDYGRRNY